MGAYKQSPVLSSLNILAKISFALLVCLVELFSETVTVSFNKPCSGIAQILTQWGLD